MPDFPRTDRRRVLAAGLAIAALPGLARADTLDAFVGEHMKAATIPGLAVGLARDGVVRLARGYGLADIATGRAVTADTRFHIASLTKTVTATAVMQLAEDGRLALDAPVGPHLDFPLANPRHPEAPITVRQLLTHTSSLSDARYYEIDFRTHGHDATQGLGDFLKAYLAPGGAAYAADGCFSAKAPGEAWDYSNVGYALLGYLAERAGGEDMRDLTRRHLFAPLGLKRTTWTIAETPAAQSAAPYDTVEGVQTPVAPVGFPDWPVGMMRSSITDFTRFAAAAANGGTSRGIHILRPETMTAMLDMQTPAGLPDWLTGQGLGWMESGLEGARRPNHWGGDPGVFTAVYLDPASRTAAVVFTNTTVSPEARAAVKAVVARLLETA